MNLVGAISLAEMEMSEFTLSSMQTMDMRNCKMANSFGFEFAKNGKVSLCHSIGAALGCSLLFASLGRSRTGYDVSR